MIKRLLNGTIMLNIILISTAFINFEGEYNADKEKGYNYYCYYIITCFSYSYDNNISK